MTPTHTPHKPWTDAQLAEYQTEAEQEAAAYRAGPNSGNEVSNTANAHRYERKAELYRLARLGLSGKCPCVEQAGYPCRECAANETLLAERDQLKAAARFPCNTIIWEGTPGFVGEWVAVPREDFDALRALLKDGER